MRQNFYETVSSHLLHYGSRFEVTIRLKNFFFTTAVNVSPLAANQFLHGHGEHERIAFIDESIRRDFLSQR